MDCGGSPPVAMKHWATPAIEASTKWSQGLYVGYETSCSQAKAKMGPQPHFRAEEVAGLQGWCLAQEFMNTNVNPEFNAQP